MITVSITLFWVVLILSIIAVVIALIRENPLTSTFFFYCAYAVTCLALLWGGR
jgi:hypothetical protein